MKLNILERILLLNLLPQKETIDILRIIRDLKINLSFSESEHKEFELKNENGQIMWNVVKGNEEREISIGEKATDVCINALKEANKDKLLTEQHLSLYDKFIR